MQLSTRSFSVGSARITSLISRRRTSSWAEKRRRNFCSSSKAFADGRKSDQDTIRQKYDLLFCGTDNFALPILKRLENEKDLFNSIQVLTPRDTAQKWGAKRMRVSPVKEWAETSGLVTHSVPAEGLKSMNIEEVMDLPPASILPHSSPSSSTEPDNLSYSPSAPTPLLVTASFGHYLPPSFLSQFPPGHVLNVHPSLLPKLRGAAPIQWAIARQISETGVSVQRIEGEGWDVGDVLGRREFSMPPDADYLSMEPVLAKIGSELLVSIIRNFSKFSMEAQPQDHSAATKAPKLKRSHVEVNWEEWDASKVEARSRAMSYMFPLTTTLVPSRSGNGIPTSSVRVLLPKVSVLKSSERKPSTISKIKESLSDASLPYGTASLSHDLQFLAVKCPASRGDFLTTSSSDSGEPSSSFLLIHTLKTEGKQERNAQDWMVGYSDRADEAGRLRFEFQVAK